MSTVESETQKCSLRCRSHRETRLHPFYPHIADMIAPANSKQMTMSCTFTDPEADDKIL